MLRRTEDHLFHLGVENDSPVILYVVVGWHSDFLGPDDAGDG
jgi:hypothetical protein